MLQIKTKQNIIQNGHTFLTIHTDDINSWRLWIRNKNAFLNLINYQPDIDKIYLYAKDSYEAKYEFLISKCEKAGLKHCNDPKTFIEYSNDMQGVCKKIEQYNPGKKPKVLIFFDDMAADMIANENFNSVVICLL